MPKVEIYTSIMCGYCTRAIRLLESKNIAYEEIDVSMSSEIRASMRSRSGGSNSAVSYTHLTLPTISCV